MRSIKLYGTGSATANNVANVVIPTSTRLLGVQFSVRFDMASDNNSVVLEVSQASATEVAVNGAQQCICEIASWNNFTTSGMVASNSNGFLPVDLPLKQGQIIYLHATVASATYYFTGLLWLRD